MNKQISCFILWLNPSPIASKQVCNINWNLAANRPHIAIQISLCSIRISINIRPLNTCYNAYLTHNNEENHLLYSEDAVDAKLTISSFPNEITKEIYSSSLFFPFSLLFSLKYMTQARKNETSLLNIRFIMFSLSTRRRRA